MILAEARAVDRSRATKAVDRLIRITHGADVGTRRREKPHHAVLRGVDVLVLVDEQMSASLLRERERLVARCEKLARAKHEIVEIDRARSAKLLLVARR